MPIRSAGPTLLRVLGEPPDLSPRRVLALARAYWDGEVAVAEPLPVEDRAYHWLLGDDGGHRWVATVDPLDSAWRRQRLVASYTAAARLTGRVDLVLAPVAGRAGAVAVDLSPGYLLSVAPYREPVSPPDDARAHAASLVAGLHAVSPPRDLPDWSPRIGVRRSPERERLAGLLSGPSWARDECTELAWRLLEEHRAAVEDAVRALDLLAAAVTGTAATWVPTHGAPVGPHVVHTAEGPRLAGWSGLARAPRERDLWQLCGARGDDVADPEPELAYLAAGGLPQASPDVLDLFELDHRLGEVGDLVLQLAGPHRTRADDSGCLTALADELAVLARRTD